MDIVKEYRKLILKRNELNKKGIVDTELDNQIKEAYILAFNYIEKTIELEKVFL